VQVVVEAGTGCITVALRCTWNWKHQFEWFLSPLLCSAIWVWLTDCMFGCKLRWGGQVGVYGLGVVWVDQGGGGGGERKWLDMCSDSQ